MEGLPGGCNPADVLFKLAHARGIKAPLFEQVRKTTDIPKILPWSFCWADLARRRDQPLRLAMMSQTAYFALATSLECSKYWQQRLQVSEQGPPHAKTFTCSCSFLEVRYSLAIIICLIVDLVQGQYNSVGQGRSKKDARNASAKSLIEQLDLTTLPQVGRGVEFCCWLFHIL